ncbi:MAG: thiamine pyrophosphate-binding protein [Desulfobacterales bacterium]|nr:thiamine pyrophosphate-binding protein [Desulfobacterales bacterium]
MPATRYGSDLIVDVIKQYDFDYVSINPGSSFRAVHDSLVHYGGNRKPEIIECPHENTAVGMAHGYARATGKPMLVFLHNLVGLLHGTMAIYYAFIDRVPMVVAGATGPMDIAKRRPHMDWIHTALLQGNAIRDYVKWDDQPYSIASVPDSFARAYRVACTEPKGPTYICFDIPLQEEPLEQDVPLLNVNRLMPPTLIHADPAAIEKAADLLVNAGHPVALAGFLGRNKTSVDKLVQLSELLSMPVMDLRNRFNFPNTHPLDLTGSDCLKDADLILSLDVRSLAAPTTSYSSETPLKPTLSERIKGRSSILSENCRIIEMGFSDLGISSWAMEYGKINEVDLSILCDTATALPALIAACGKKLSDNPARQAQLKGRFEQISRQHARMRDEWKIEAQDNWDVKPMTVARLAAEVWQVLKDEDWVVTTSGGLKEWARKLWDFDRPDCFPGAGLGTGTQINMSLGVALAYRETGKLVVDIQADGDLLFDAGALWVATHHHIPMLIVMLNNRAYQNSWKHARSMAKIRGNPAAKVDIGTEIDHPAPDFAKLAQSFGWYAEGPVEDGRKVQEAVKRAIQVIKKEKRPALVDTIVQR